MNKIINYTPANILGFWFLDENKPKWFIQDKEFDKVITEKFLGYYNVAASGSLDYWKGSSEGIVALIIILDQFSRNIFRGLAQSFATDSKALTMVKEAIDQGMDQEVFAEYRHFLYMPLMHSEDLEDQNLSVKLFSNEPSSYEYAKMHMEIIKKFGRFPHRNKILGRKSTEEEIRFLTTPNSSF